MGHYFSIRDIECIIRLTSLSFLKLSLVSFSHNMSNELLLCKHKHFKHQHKGEAIMYPSTFEYMYNHGAHLSLIIVSVLYHNFLDASCILCYNYLLPSCTHNRTIYEYYIFTQ